MPGTKASCAMSHVSLCHTGRGHPPHAANQSFEKDFLTMDRTDDTMLTKRLRFFRRPIGVG